MLPTLYTNTYHLASTTERTPSPIPLKPVSLPGTPLTPPKEVRRATPNPSPRPIEEGVRRMLSRTRTDLRNNDGVIYLRRPDIVAGNYTFIHSKEFAANIAVLDADLQKFKVAMEAHANDPQGQMRPNEPLPTTFAVVIKIDDNSPFLRSDSAWSPRSRSPFPKTKQTFIGRRPPHEVFNADYQVAMTNLANLFDLGCKYGLPASTGVFNPSAADREAIKFRNALFTVRDHN